MANVDTTAPTLVSFKPDGPSVTATGKRLVTYKLVFSEDVTGVTTAAFALDPSDTDSAASIVGLAGSGANYYITVDTGGAGNGGTIQLQFNPKGVQDLAGNAFSPATGGYQLVGTIGLTGSAGSGYNDVDFADFNHDGRADLVNSYHASAGDIFDNGYVQIKLGNGDGTFTLVATVEAGLSYSYAVKDVNGDGNLDLVIVNPANPYHSTPYDNTVEVLFGDGKGGFTLDANYVGPNADTTGGVQITPSSGNPSTVDLNGDGVADRQVYYFDPHYGYGGVDLYLNVPPIVGSSTTVFNAATKSSYSILVQVTDENGKTFQQSFTITVLPVPTAIWCAGRCSRRSNFAICG